MSVVVAAETGDGISFFVAVVEPSFATFSMIPTDSVVVLVVVAKDLERHEEEEQLLFWEQKNRATINIADAVKSSTRSRPQQNKRCLCEAAVSRIIIVCKAQ